MSAVSGSSWHGCSTTAACLLDGVMSTIFGGRIPPLAALLGSDVYRNASAGR